jgi:competence protein CoiA
MQVYALDGKLQISCLAAEKRKNYTCPLCGASVRVKRGKERQPHFYHLDRAPTCRLAQKGEIHLQLQEYVKSLFELEAVIEMRFPEISRIADVACPKQKKVYEIQYSPMSLEEAKMRCRDYESIGYQVIWILHDDRFNRRRRGPAERFLRTKTCYYTGWKGKGLPLIYDQLDHLRGAVDLRLCSALPSFKWPESLRLRAKTRPLYHCGDFFDLALKGKVVEPRKKRKIFSRLKEAYLCWLYNALDKSCK